MSRPLTVFVTLALVGAASLAFAADTDLDKFTKFARKFAAADAAAKPKGLCVCQDGSALHGAAGYLIAPIEISSIARVALRCSVPSFSSGAEHQELSRTNCLTFVAVGK